MSCSYIYILTPSCESQIHCMFVVYYNYVYILSHFFVQLSSHDFTEPVSSPNSFIWSLARVEPDLGLPPGVDFLYVFLDCGDDTDS